MTQQDLAIRSRESAASESGPRDPSERRKSRRFALSASADILELSTRTRLAGRASDLGVGGCYVDTVSPFPVGTSVMIKLVSGNQNVAAKAAVTYAQTGMGMGLVFNEISGEEKKKLDAWLRELGGEPPLGDREPLAETSKIHQPTATAKPSGVADVLQDLVVMLKNKGMLTEAEVELLREKMPK